MRMPLLGALALAATAAVAVGAGGGGLGVGDKAPFPVSKELVGFSSYSPKDLDGKVVFIEVFRTW